MIEIKYTVEKAAGKEIWLINAVKKDGTSTVMCICDTETKATSICLILNDFVEKFNKDFMEEYLNE